MTVNASFFLSSVEDQCLYNGVSIDASGNTDNGNLCAYIEGFNRVWACPAPERVCWTRDQPCRGGSGQPDDTQTFCSSNGSEWCCSKEYDECTRAPGQINVCLGQWRNPTYNMTTSEAVQYNKAHYSTLASSTSTTAAATSRVTSATATTATGVSTTAASTSTSEASSSATASSASLSSGALAGVAVGSALGGIAIAALGALIFWRRWKRSRAASPRWADDNDSGAAVKLDSEALELHPGARPMEMDAAGTHALHEMSNEPRYDGRHEAQELPGRRYE